MTLVIGLTLQASPARRGYYTYTQPDGSTFRALLQGDERYHSLTTQDGCSVFRDRDGWYCYAALSAEGDLTGSGVRIGEKAPRDIVDASRNIPHNALRARAVSRHRAATLPKAVTMSGETGKTASKTRKAIIILAQFPDLKFRDSESETLSKFSNLINGKNSGSAHDYLDSQFQGEWNFELTVTKVVTLSKKYSYYGADQGSEIDIHAAEAVAEACRLANAEVDFSQYDSDKDGYVDGVFVFAAGPNQAMGAADDHIWPHQWSIRAGTGSTLTLDGVQIDNYAISTELDGAVITGSPFASIGTFCHEYSHTLGLADLYDTDFEDSEGCSNGLWGLSLMDTGNYANNGKTPPCYTAVDMWQLGIGKCEIISRPGLYSLKPLSTEKRYFMLETDNPDEVYLMECRAASGWDRYIGGSGLVIYHIDISGRQAGYSSSEEQVISFRQRWNINEINANPSYMAAEIVGAKPKANEVRQLFWPYGTAKAFTPGTQPGFTYHSGGFPSIAIKNITKEVDSISFAITGPVTIDMTDSFQDACIVQWSVQNAEEESCTISWTGKNGTEKAQVNPYAPGLYAYTIEGLDAKSEYEIKIWTQSDPKSAAISSISTKAYYSSGFPFIYLSSTDRNSDGSFSRGTRTPLRVYNAKKASAVKWYLDGKPICVEKDGYYTIQNGGKLMAEVYYMNGEKEFIVKKIKIK